MSSKRITGLTERTNLASGDYIMLDNASLGSGKFDATKLVSAPWELIREDTVTNVTDAPVNITVDDNAQPFELTDIRILFQTPIQETQAIIGQYGRVNFFYGNNVYDCMYMSAYTQNANAPARTSMFSIEQQGGMIDKIMVKNSQDNGEVAMYVGNNFAKNAINGRWVMVTQQRIYTKIVLDSLTGTIKYRLYGKRKWS